MFNKKKSTARKAVIDWQQGLQPASEILSLEQRIMLDAAAPATVDAVNDSLNTDTTAADTAADEATLSEALVDNSRRQEIVFVDSSIEGHEDLLADIFAAGEEIYWQPADASNVEFTTVVTDDRVITIFAIDGNEQGFSALTDTLGSKHSIDAIHILSHGTEAGVKMGAETIANDSLGRYADQLSVWGDALNSDGDILLYGCNVGVEGAGVEFVQSFARITNADVAASDDYTGAEQYGGDWQLEVASGSVETELVAGEFAAALFDGVLVKEVPVPTATLSVPANDFLGESFIFTATFDNTAVDGDSLGDVGVGYAPYLNVFVEPGVTVNSADYLGSAVDLGTRFTWDAANSQWRDSGSTPVTGHPFGPASDFALPADPGVDGTVWYLIELPFGSFTYNQPPAEVAFNATLDRAAGATVGTALAIGAQGGFRFGADPQNNPAGDAPLLQASPTAATITPLLLDISNTVAGAGNNSAGAENEAATGPNDPITWRINVDIAAGETVNNIVITDLVPNDFFYTGNLTVSGAASGTFVNLATVDATTGVANGNQFSVTFDSVTGGTASDDIVITYTGYIPDVDANGAPILTPSNAALQGDAAAGQIVNNVQIDANYDNGSGLAAIPTDSASETVTPKAIAIQKDVTNVIDANATGNSAGDTLEWTLRLQVSDYFSMENFVVTDVFSDGQLLDSGFTPTYRVIENGADSGVSNFAGGNYTLNAIDAGTGLTTLEFRLSDQLGGDGVLDGDAAANAGGDGRTTVEIKFRTVVQENFQFPASLAGDASVDVNDLLTNNVSVSAEVGGTGNAVSDGSGASVQVVGPSQTKEIYAVNGDTEFTNAELTPGSTVTYRITVNLPTADVENLSIVDFLPLPVFDVNAAFTYGGQFSGSDNVPVSGQYGFGPLTNNADFPADYFNGASPSFGVTVTPDSNANTMTFDFNSFDVDNSTGGVIDLLFTVTAVDAAFADGLQLTNQATVSSSNSNNPQPTAMSIQQIELLAPELDITKGIVAVDASSTGSFGTPLPSTGISFNAANSGGAPFSGGTITSAVIGTKPLTSDVVGVDAGDVVRFALVIENTGGEDAFDITIRDALPPGYAYTGNLAVTLGDGTVVDVSSINLTDLFTAGGITLPDSVAAGLAAAGRDATTVTNDGSNIILVTYDATLQSSANALETLTSTAEILAFAGLEGGADYTAGSSDPQWRDSADTTLSGTTITKEIANSGIVDADNGPRDAVVGEFVQYELVIQVPEGEMPLAEILDNLDSGLVFVSLDSVTPSSGAVTTGTVTPPSAGSTGTLAFDLGTITNANTDNSTAETLTLRYTVRVANDANALNGAELNSDVKLRWDVDGNGANTNTNDGSVNDSDGSIPNHRVTVLEPELDVTQLITTAPADEGDAIVYQITINHDSLSSASAYDVTFSDVVPAGISVSSITATHSAAGDIGPTGSNILQLSSNTVTTGAGLSFDLLEAESVVITITGTLTNAIAGADVINSATINWSSLDAATVDGDDANERDGSSGYVGTSLAASFTADSVALIKEVVSTGIVTADNANLEASIGEYVNYRIVVTLPEGDAPLAQIVDTLAAGLVFDAANGITVTRSGAGISTDMAGGFASASAAVAGQAITIDLGNISNDNTDNGVAETLTIEYRAYVANDSSAQPAGVFRDDTLGGSVEFRWDADGNAANDDGSAGDSDADPINAITIVEADLEVIKTITTTPADLGDVVAYQIVLRHTGNSNTSAYDVTFSDLVDSGIAVNNISATHSSAGAIGPGATGVIEIAGNNVQTAAGQSFDLLEGETLTITINGTVSGAAAGATIGNTATVNWSSLDSASATDGNEAAERGGNGSGRADGSDAYTDTSAAVEFTVNDATIIKRVINTGLNNAVNNNSGAVIGEYVQYEVVVTVPEGDLPLAEIIDPLEAGLEFVSLDSVTASNAAQLTTDLAGGFTAVSGPAAGTAGSFTLNLGNVSNSNADNSTAETITILYTARVANNPGTATAGAVLGNTVELRWDTNASGGNTEAGDGNVTDSDGSSANNEVTILEPALTVVKSVNEDEPFLGETITYTVTVTNQNAANGSDAFDLNLTDTLPTGMTLDVASIRVDGLASGANANVLTDSSSGNDVNLVLRQLAFDSAITLTYAATVSAAPADFGATLDSNATVNWSSLDAGNSGDGDESAERGGDAAGVSDGSDGYTANDGEAVTLTAYNLAITTDDGGATVTANGNAVYTIDYANNGTRDASGVVITETLPAGASFDAGNSTAGWLDQGAGIYTFTVGNLTAGGSGSVNFAVTADATFAAGQDILSNSASIAADNVNGTDLDPANNTTSDTTPVIAVPDLNISNDDAGITVLPNGTVVYTLNYANSGLQGASGVVITETVPPGSSFDAANSTPGWSETAPGSGVFTFAVGIVPAGGSGSVDFAVAADATFIAGQDELANTASITDDGSNGADPDLLNNNAVDDTPIDAAPDYRVIKSSDNGNAYLVPGQLVTYTITVLNDGAQDGTGVVVSDSWQSSVFEDPIAISNGGSYNGGSGEITWNVGSMAVGSSVDLTVTAMVRSTLTAGINTVTNSAAATDDLSNGVDPTPVNNTGSDTDSIDAALPDYRIIKSSNNTGPLSAGQIVTYTLEVFNDGNQDGTGIVVRDNFPLGVFTSPSTISNGGTFDPASGEIVWNFADLAAGDSLTLSVTATLAAVVPAGFDEVANTASVSDDGSNGPDIVDNNTATDTDVVDAAPDYFVTVSNNNNGDLEVGETVTYIVDYGNQGTQDGTNVAVTVVVPSGVFLAPSSIGGGGVYAPATGTITWTVDNLAGGESGQFSFGATVNDAVAAGFDDAEVKADIADDGQNGPDLNPANNSDNVIDPVNAAPDYVVDKDDGIDFVPRNVDFNYRINVTNAGTQDGTGVIVTDTFPTEILAIVDADGGMIDQGAGTITWNIDTLAVGEQLQFDVVVQVLSTAVIDNSDQLFSSAVSVTGDNDNGADLNPANNNAVASTQLLSDVGDVNFLLDGSRDPRAALHFSGEYPRDFEYNAYPHWLHGRLVGLETMQVEANLVAARTEVELDSAFGLWNHSFYPNPWNHLRAGNTETQELNADYSHWAEPRLNQAIVNGNAVDRINLDGTMVDFADLEQAPNLPQQEAQLQLFKRAVQHEKAMPPGDSSGTRQFEQAANTLRAASIEELVAAFREGRK